MHSRAVMITAVPYSADFERILLQWHQYEPASHGPLVDDIAPTSKKLADGTLPPSNYLEFSTVTSTNVYLIYIFLGLFKF
jgi:hypothetical protein